MNVKQRVGEAMAREIIGVEPLKGPPGLVALLQKKYGVKMDFSDFFGNPDPIVQQMAQKLSDYAQQLKSGALTQAEYNDLASDATTLDDVARAGKTVGELEALDEAISALQTIAGAV